MIRLKTPEEIEMLQEGGRRLAEILSILASKVSPGVSTLSLEEETLRLIKENGDQPAFRRVAALRTWLSQHCSETSAVSSE